MFVRMNPPFAIIRDETRRVHGEVAMSGDA